jgi:hypothetical protein
MLRMTIPNDVDRHPRAKVILGHMEEFFSFQLSRLDSRYPILRRQGLRQPPSGYFGQNIFITTSGAFSPASLAGAVMAMGEDDTSTSSASAADAARGRLKAKVGRRNHAAIRDVQSTLTYNRSS